MNKPTPSLLYMVVLAVYFCVYLVFFQKDIGKTA
jgi:hypothetical protein